MRLSWADRLLLIEAGSWLVCARLLLLVVPFRRLAPFLGRPMKESPPALTDAEDREARRVAWAVNAWARRVPLGFVCLPQAIASTWMLRRRRTPSTLYLGLRHQQSSGIAGHAWVRAGQTIVTGRAESSQHQVIAAFALEPVSGARQERIATPAG